MAQHGVLLPGGVHAEINETELETTTPELAEEQIKEAEAIQQWRNDTRNEELDEIDAVGEYMLARQEQSELQIWAAEKPAECESQKMMQQTAIGLLPMDRTLAVRLLTGDNTLAVTRVGPMTVQVYKRRTVAEFEVKRSGKDNEGNCYTLVPVVLPGGRQHYLKPGTNQLVPEARQINCEERPKFVSRIGSHQFMTTKARQTVHSIPPLSNYKCNDEEKITKLSTEHFYAAQKISGLIAEDSIQRQAQQLHEQRKLQQQMKRLYEPLTATGWMDTFSSVKRIRRKRGMVGFRG